MLANVSWEDGSKTVLIFQFTGLWSVQDYYIIVDQSNTMMDTVEHTVNMIIDLQHSKSLPDGFLSAVRSVSKRPHPNSGRVALVGLNAFVRAIIDVYRKTMGKNADAWMTFVPSYDDAHQFFASAHKIPLS